VPVCGVAAALFRYPAATSREWTLHGIEHILQLMKSLLIEVDDELAVRLERVAPARSRRRSEFVRTAILKALWEVEEQATAEAYARQPDSLDAAFDPTVWEGCGAPGER
jgi:predicted DNA-binding protein